MTRDGDVAEGVSQRREELAPAGIDVRHRPIHPAAGRAVSFAMKLKEPTPIQQVALEAKVFTPGVRTGDWTAPNVPTGGARVWNANELVGLNALQHSVPGGFPDRSLVLYTFTVTYGNGSTQRRSVAFAVGDWPWADEPVPLYMQGSLDHQIRTCFVPDQDDTQSWASFTQQVEHLVYDGFFENVALGERQDAWSIFATPLRGDANDAPRRMVLPAQARNWSMDVFGIVHEAPQYDASWTNIFTVEPESIGTAVHEVGHVVFGLADEYSGKGWYTQADPEPNLLKVKADCEANNQSRGWPSSDCSIVVGRSESWYRPEPRQPDCIMRDDADRSLPAFERSCLGRIRWYYGRIPQALNVDLSTGKPVVPVTLSYSGGGWKVVSVGEPRPGRVTPLRIHPDGFVIEGVGGTTRPRLGIRDPRYILEEEPPDARLVPSPPDATTVVFLPFDRRIRELVIIGNGTGPRENVRVPLDWPGERRLRETPP